MKSASTESVHIAKKGKVEMKWNKTGKKVNAEGTTITYECDDLPGIKIESRKRHIPHANGVGTWDHTTYFVIGDGVELKEKWSLKDAQRYAEELK